MLAPGWTNPQATWGAPQARASVGLLEEEAHVLGVGRLLAFQSVKQGL